MASIGDGLGDLFRALQRAEVDIAARDQALRLAWEFWRVVREVSTNGPNGELITKLDKAERKFLDAVDVLGWKSERPQVICATPTHIERIEK